MAAAALSSSRGVAGGLYILFTLLCLVCLASSRINDDDELKYLKEDIQKAEQDLKDVKAQRATFSELMSKSMSNQEAMTAFLEGILEESPDDSLQQKRILEDTKGLMKKLKTYLDEQNELLDAKMANIELKLGKLKKFIQAIEEYQAEL